LNSKPTSLGKLLAVAAATLLAFPALAPAAHGAGLSQLKILYIGDASSQRAREYRGFLELNVGEVQVANRADFRPEQAEPFDVVLLDWPQSAAAREERTQIPPLGEREGWSKPTVLLGSAGLNLAVGWKIKGGSG
jgi:hypothetical protein